MSLVTDGRKWLQAATVDTLPARMVLGLAALLLVCLAGLAFYQLLYVGRVVPGAVVLGQDLGGMTREQAAAAARSRFSDYEQSDLILTYGDATWTRSPRQMGLRLDGRGTAQSAFQAGRTGNLWDILVGPIVVLKDKVVIDPVLSLDREQMGKALDDIAAEIDREAVDARLVISPDGKVEVSPSRTGRKLDRDETSRQLERKLLALSADPIGLIVREEKPAVVESQLEGKLESAKTALSAPLTIRFEDRAWSLDPPQLAALLVPSQAGASDPCQSGLTLDPGETEGLLRGMATEVDRAPVDASLTLVEGNLVLTPHQDGRRVDLAASRELLTKQAFHAERSVSLKVDVVPALVREEDLLPIKAQAENVLGSPLTLTFEDKFWVVDQSLLAQSFRLGEGTVDGKPLAKVEMDDEVLTAFVQAIAPEVARQPKDARFRFEDDAVMVTTESVDGVTLDVPGTVQAIKEAAVTDQRQVPLVVQVEHPQVQSSDAAKIVIRDVLARNSSDYSGGSAERRHNIVLATSKLDGVVVPPGGVFSFNAAVGPTTTDNGYQDGYAIVIDEGKPRTVPSVAGGICQVATTLFQAVFYAGLPIEERHPHFYWIPRYGRSALGLKGLDTTVDEAYGVDFRFRNSTDNWLAIQTGADDANIYFAIMGTDPGWTVEIDDPIITDIVPADPKPVEEIEPSFPPEKRVQVEVAQDGFTSVINRRVLKGNQVIDETSVSSRYVPARNAFLVGPRPVCEPVQEGTPTPSVPCFTPTPGSTLDAQGTPEASPPAGGTPVEGGAEATATPPAAPPETPAADPEATQGPSQ